ncbi:MAG: DNA repair protein RecO C-terminal domain-containing protein [Bacteroidales bacterium]|nr:DNA repair protein RecO C-terminal domain-containing protein [Bacteroidales bacterium]
MLPVSDRQIVLHTTKYSENAVVVHALSRNWGRRGFLVHGAGKVTSRLLPLNINEVEVIPNRMSSLYVERDINVLHPLAGIRGNMFKNSITLFVSEVLFKALPDNVTDESLYDWCENEILVLDSMDNNFANYHLHFLLGLCARLGYAPDWNSLLPFAGEHILEVQKLFGASFAEAMALPLTGEVRSEIADSLVKYLEFHSEKTIRIRSLEVLRSLFV